MNPPNSGVLTPARARAAIFALAMGGFAIGTTEFVAMGLLPDIARDLDPALYSGNQDAALANAGWMITVYALGVVVGAPTIAAIGARLPRKTLLLWLLGAFALSTVATAVLPSFGLVLAARFIAGLPHGAYFGIASLVAASLLGMGRRGRAVSLVMLGLTISNVIGVPLITFVGQSLGWRVAYLVVALIFALTFVAVWCVVPKMEGDPGATVRRELKVFGNSQVWLAMLIGAIGFGGFFAVYTYVSPLTTEVTGAGQEVVPWVLATMGVGMTFGTMLGGRFADLSVSRTMIVSFVLVIASLIGLAFLVQSLPGLLIGVFAVGITTQALGPTIQTRLMDVAKDSQSIAAALNHSAFNIGNAAGAYLGGVVIAAGYGFISPIWVGVVLAIGGLFFATVSVLLDRRRR
ncbi:MFS transporter [Lysinibacter cavernae]|uniref:DHA1 family inner membrane transport protein n=1 Tax=Lysinibacter cavernae TaxID=1640652 RepID=A0A7X5TTV0_9MICO|nr:DHA1 family inner membrane transport protein [Lysinibacter cavernae]